MIGEGEIGHALHAITKSGLYAIQRCQTEEDVIEENISSAMKTSKQRMQARQRALKAPMKLKR